jgi:hypothetical protein
MTNFLIYFSEREYRCLGQWEENGVIFSYTQRRDVLGYECFVGVVTSDGSIYIKEAAVNCLRGQDPLRNGMQLVQTGMASCRNQTPFILATSNIIRIISDFTPVRFIFETFFLFHLSGLDK